VGLSKGRGNNDFYASKDFEDIIALLDGATAAEKEIAASFADVRNYLAHEFGLLCRQPDMRRIIEGHLSPATEGAQRIERCLDLIRRFAAG